MACPPRRRSCPPAPAARACFARRKAQKASGRNRGRRNSTHEFPRYSPPAVGLGIGAQAAIQLFHDGESAGLNLYARTSGSFDRSTVQFAELFATHAGAPLGYAVQVEQLSEALHTRTDIGTAVGILMERYRIDRHQAFAFLTRNPQNRNVKVRVLATQIINGVFTSTASEDSASGTWP